MTQYKVRHRERSVAIPAIEGGAAVSARTTVLFFAVESGRYKPFEKRMRFIGAGFEFGVELATYIVGQRRNFYRFYESAVGRSTRKSKPRVFEFFSVIVIEFVSVAVAFGYIAFAVRSGNFCTRF